MYAQLTVVTTSPSENYDDHSPSGQVSLNSDTSSKHENSMERARGVYSTALSHKIIDTREKKKVIAVVESFTSIVNRLA